MFVPSLCIGNVNAKEQDLTTPDINLTHATVATLRHQLRKLSEECSQYKKELEIYRTEVGKLTAANGTLEPVNQQELARLKSLVKRDVFKHIKFITDTSQLLPSHKIARRIKKVCNISNDRYLRWWASYQPYVIEAINEKRSSVTGDMRTIFMGESF